MSTPAGCGRTELPCRAAPERWFDRNDRAHALAGCLGCLGCPARGPCARQALRGATWGMWAGIWIDDNLDEVAPYLHQIARMPPVGAARHRTRSAAPLDAAEPGTTRRRAAPGLSPVAAGTRARRSTTEMVLARCCGHCEIMAPGCRLDFQVVMRRTPGGHRDRRRDASTLYAACTACRDTVSRLDEPIAGRLGYLVGPGPPPGAVAFYWRQARWMLLRPDGGLHDPGART